MVIRILLNKDLIGATSPNANSLLSSLLTPLSSLLSPLLSLLSCLLSPLLSPLSSLLYPLFFPLSPLFSPLSSWVQVFFGYFLFFLVFFGFMCMDVAKTARVTRMRLMPKLQSVFFGYFFWLCRRGSCRPCNRTHAFLVVWFCRFTPFGT